MGLLLSNTQSNEEIQHYTFIKEECNMNKKNKQNIKNIFIREWNIVCNKWNLGTIRGYDFNCCTYIIKYMDDEYLFIIYNKMVKKWNNGTINGNDLSLITYYLRKK